MAKSEGQSRPFEPISSIKTDLLETFPYTLKEVKYTPHNHESDCEIVPDPHMKHIRQMVRYQTDELSAVCPFSGLPDIAELEISYIPHERVMELKSLKYYLTSFRNVGIYQEHLTRRIYTDLKATLEPQFLKIITKYNTRGGINAICEISSDDQK